MARFAHGKTLDVGFADAPNPFLSGSVTGLDVKAAKKPTNYETVVQYDVESGDGLGLAPASFDTITAGEVIEHLKHPIAFLDTCSALLKPSGRLVVATVNPFYPPIILLNWLMLRRFFYAEDHLFAFTPRLMVRLLERAGFSLERVVSGGVALPIGDLTLPAPRAISYELIYVARKMASDQIDAGVG